MGRTHRTHLGPGSERSWEDGLRQLLRKPQTREEDKWCRVATDVNNGPRAAHLCNPGNPSQAINDLGLGWLRCKMGVITVAAFPAGVNVMILGYMP